MQSAGNRSLRLGSCFYLLSSFQCLPNTKPTKNLHDKNRLLFLFVPEQEHLNQLNTGHTHHSQVHIFKFSFSDQCSGCGKETSVVVKRSQPPPGTAHVGVELLNQGPHPTSKTFNNIHESLIHFTENPFIRMSLRVRLTLHSGASLRNQLERQSQIYDLEIPEQQKHLRPLGNADKQL